MILFVYIGILKECGLTSSYESNFILRKYESSIGRNLIDLNNIFPTYEYMFRLSHELNSCTPKLDIASHKEIIRHLSLSLFPANTLTIKNLAYDLEKLGSHEDAESLLQSCINLTGDLGCILHYIFNSIQIPLSIAHSLVSYARIHFKFNMLYPMLTAKRSHYPFGLEATEVEKYLHQEADSRETSLSSSLPYYYRR